MITNYEINLEKSKSKSCVTNTIRKPHFQSMEHELNILFKKELESNF